MRSMVRLLSAMVTLGLTLNTLALDPPGFTPPPKRITVASERWVLSEPGKTVLVLGDRADEPERYAAERLQGALRSWAGAEYPICVESGIPAGARQLILLGRPETHALVAHACTVGGWDVSKEAPGSDGHLIEMVESEGRQIVLITGNGPRGVIYGASAFAAWLAQSPVAGSFSRVSLRDWPDIPWRAFAWNTLDAYLDPGRLDRYVDARLNFIELRDGPPPMRGHFGVPPEFEPDREKLSQLLREARRRAFMIYGVVFCGVTTEQQDGALRQFDRFAEAGVDALYLSFDDPGMGGDPDAMVARALERARALGYTGERVAILTSNGNYQRADTPLNRRLARIPGAGDAVWFFTAVPGERAARAARRIGLTRKTGWWINWPIAHDGALSFGTGYLPLPPLARGWGRPTYDQLRDAAQHIDRAMVWVRAPDEYLNRVFGIWAWNPAGHDWAATERAVYGHVFGPEQVDEARQFDARMQELINLFARDGPGDWNTWIIRLSDPGLRPEARRLLERLDQDLKTLETRAPAETAMDSDRLRSLYLIPMRRSLKAASRMIELDFPDDLFSLAELQRERQKLIDAGRTDAWRDRAREIRTIASPLLLRIESTLGELPQTRRYLDGWRTLLEEPD
ncbi:MAG: hypothetical protein KBA51_01850 [Kiritimatiellae bacterium]|nr:hypothetical protein [Kiritimatiellia bacterium]